MAEHAQPYGRIKTPKTLKETTNEPKGAFETGNSPLDSRPETLPVRQHLVDEILHALWNGQRLHLLGQLRELRLGRAEAHVSCQDFRCGPEKFLVPLDHRLCQ